MSIKGHTGVLLGVERLCVLTVAMSVSGRNAMRMETLGNGTDLQRCVNL